ncbi:hypothetical protein ACH5RR_005475 [Cinchona calisaya]|uniref:Uncharacterized protein n=1 Tax=Cinchona calisaya TaxID=153742 RepID=A0ABD3ALB1_9GENT
MLLYYINGSSKKLPSPPAFSSRTSRIALLPLLENHILANFAVSMLHEQVAPVVARYVTTSTHIQRDESRLSFHLMKNERILQMSILGIPILRITIDLCWED